MSTNPLQQPSEFDALEPSPVPKKQLKPGKWFGFIALLCGLEPVVMLCYGYLVMPFMPCCTSPWQEIMMALGIGSLICAPAGIVFGILGLKTEGRRYAWSGLVLSLLYVLVFLVPITFTQTVDGFESQCLSNQERIVQAFQSYADKHGALPPLYTVDDDGNPLHSWRVLILPFMGETGQHLYSFVRLDEPWNSEHNKRFHDKRPFFYHCPVHWKNSPNSLLTCSYSVIAGGSFFPAESAGSITGLKIEDMSNEFWSTVALVEVKEPFNWMDPTADVTLEEFIRGERIGGQHLMAYAILFNGGITNVEYAAQNLPNMPEDVYQNVRREMATPKGGE